MLVEDANGHAYDRRETEGMRFGERRWLYCHEHERFELFVDGQEGDVDQHELVKFHRDNKAQARKVLELVEWANTLARSVGVFDADGSRGAQGVVFTPRDFATIAVARRAERLV